MLTQAEAELFESQAKEAGVYRAEVYVGHAGYGVRVWPTKNHAPWHITDLRGKRRDEVMTDLKRSIGDTPEIQP